MSVSNVPDKDIGTTYEIGTANREDLLDFITNISPTATPFISAVRKTTAYSTTHEWPTDTLASAAENAKVEGYDPDYPALNDRTRGSNYTQIFANPFVISGTQEKVSKAGIRSEFAYQSQKKMAEHMRDLEYAVFNNADAGAAGAHSSTGNTARKIKGIGAFVGNTEDESSSAIQESTLKEAIRECWIDGGEPDAIFCNSTDKLNIDEFTTSVTRNIQAEARTQINNINVYEAGVGGPLRLIPSRYISKSGSPAVSSIWVLEMGRWAWAWLDGRTPMIERLAKTGDSLPGMVISEGTLEGRASNANCEITNVTA